MPQPRPHYQAQRPTLFDPPAAELHERSPAAADGRRTAQAEAWREPVMSIGELEARLGELVREISVPEQPFRQRFFSNLLLCIGLRALEPLFQISPLQRLGRSSRQSNRHRHEHLIKNFARSGRFLGQTPVSPCRPNRGIFHRLGTFTHCDDIDRFHLFLFR